MKTRILSGLIMLPLLGLLYLGGFWLMAACFIGGIFAVREFYKGFNNIGIKPNFGIAFGGSALLYAIYLIMGYGSHSAVFEESPKYIMFFFFIVIVGSLLLLFKSEKIKMEDALVSLLGIFYIVFFLSHITLVNTIPGFENFVWLIILTAFGTDIFAYFTGMLFGKHKLCPNISPKKTIEGSIGGTIGSMVLCGVFGYFFAQGYLVHCLIIGLLGGIASQFGD
ncbi:MAG: phosphatidate cytidylyltransferase, partial [Anaerovoracaceae bacterium]